MLRGNFSRGPRIISLVFMCALQLIFGQLHNEATLELLATGLTLKKCYCYPAGHVRACRRFQWAHTYDRIAKVGLLYDVNDEFNPDEHKIVATVTDNGANLVCRLI